MRNGLGWALSPTLTARTPSWVSDLQDSRKEDNNVDIVAGVVIAEDTVVTDVTAKNNINDPSSLKFGILDSLHIIGESSFSRSEIFSSGVASIKSQANTLFLVLKNKIPKELFRPICIPPARYLEKMVKPTSCQENKAQTITKVNAEIGKKNFQEL